MNFDDIQKHNRDVARLDVTRARGDQAQVAKEALKPLIDARADAYYRDVVTNTRREGKVDEATIWKMVALDDLVSDLQKAISRGAIARRKLESEEIAKAGGSNE